MVGDPHIFVSLRTGHDTVEEDAVYLDIREHWNGHEGWGRRRSGGRRWSGDRLG